MTIPRHPFIGSDRRCNAPDCRLLPEEHRDSIWIAQVDTERFDFEAYGNDEDEARDALFDGIAAHGRQYGLAPDWFDPWVDDINVREVWPGAVYRDREELA